MAWIEVAMVADIPVSGMIEAEAGGAALLVYDVGGTIYATGAVCPHHAAWLSQGGMSGDVVNCPRHMGQFHIPTGRKLRGPECPDLLVYPTRVAEGRILVEVAAR